MPDGETAVATEPDPGVSLNASPRRGRHPLARFVLRRVAAGLATLLVASLLIFLATNALPGDVAEVVLGRYATPERVEDLRQELHLNRPLPDRYGSWLAAAASGDLGQSTVAVANGAANAPVWHEIETPLRNSLILALATTIFLIPLSLLVGVAAAVRAGHPTDYAVSYTALVVGSLPEFVVGTFLIAVLFSQLHLLPPVALVPPGATPLAHPKELVLPVLTLLAVSLAFSARQVRAGTLQVLQQDFVTMARLGGLRERHVLLGYVLRNALAPSVQTFAQSIQYLFGGIIIVEALFSYPGIGQSLVQAVSQRDVTVVQGITLVLGAIYIGINILADLIVVLLVPKLRTELQ